MAGKQAKLLTDEQQKLLLAHVSTKRHPHRDRVLILLSFKAGLRAAEIAKLTWEMVLDPSGAIGDGIEVRDEIAKKGGGRIIPIHPELKAALAAWKPHTTGRGPVIRSQRGGRMTPVSICNWFKSVYDAVGFQGCSSHSGRRTFLTKAARNVHRAGGSLRDVQRLAGHRSITTTERYVDTDPASLRVLVSLI